MSKVLDFMKAKGSAFKSGEISEQTGISKAQVDKEIKILLKEGKIQSPKRCYYQVI